MRAVGEVWGRLQEKRWLFLLRELFLPVKVQPGAQDHRLTVEKRP